MMPLNDINDGFFEIKQSLELPEALLNEQLTFSSCCLAQQLEAALCFCT